MAANEEVLSTNMCKLLHIEENYHRLPSYANVAMIAMTQ